MWDRESVRVLLKSKVSNVLTNTRTNYNLDVFPRGLLNKVLYGKAPPRGPNLYPFYIPFLIEKVPLSYTFHRKLYPSSMPTERILQTFSLEKTWMNQPLGVSVRDIWKVPFNT